MPPHPISVRIFLQAVSFFHCLSHTVYYWYNCTVWQLFLKYSISDSLQQVSSDSLTAFFYVQKNAVRDRTPLIGLFWLFGFFCLSFLDKHRKNLQIWMKNRSKYPAAMGGVLILAAIAAQLKGLPRFFILFYAFLASIYSHMIRTVSSMPSLLLLIENS